jgi:hypothetical protein
MVREFENGSDLEARSVGNRDTHFSAIGRNEEGVARDLFGQQEIMTHSISFSPTICVPGLNPTDLFFATRANQVS